MDSDTDRGGSRRYCAKVGRVRGDAERALTRLIIRQCRSPRPRRSAARSNRRTRWSRSEPERAVADDLRDSGRRVRRRRFTFSDRRASKRVAVLYAEPEEQPVDVSAIELLASLAAASIEVDGNHRGEVAGGRSGSYQRARQAPGASSGLDGLPEA